MTQKEQAHDHESYWRRTNDSYDHYPTVRHRRGWILNEVKRYLARTRKRPDQLKVFDFGCGNGQILAALMKRFSLQANQIAGCDTSVEAIEIARARLGTRSLEVWSGAEPADSFDIVVCSEVIEHTPEYATILKWIFRALAPDGIALLTTQAGRIHQSDLFTGHTQHFQRQKLALEIEQLGFKLLSSTNWGFPLFTAQKYLTDLNFKAVKDNFLEGELRPARKLIFDLANLAYYVHDWIPMGPQLYLVAGKP